MGQCDASSKCAVCCGACKPAPPPAFAPHLDAGHFLCLLPCPSYPSTRPLPTAAPAAAAAATRPPRLCRRQRQGHARGGSKERGQARQQRHRVPRVHRTLRSSHALQVLPPAGRSRKRARACGRLSSRGRAMHHLPSAYHAHTRERSQWFKMSKSRGQPSPLMTTSCRVSA